ncbi:uncharacterized protein LOC116019999 [Ipomoea triloba]|uniref:uncharacterized protein LOC116019999 n=1 Tax=Ipomoea triloba TaxID=35885 RepID=UPI00125D40D2|nr:uncharacterized protein LOC116019999 [Ipomoea triloba]
MAAKQDNPSNPPSPKNTDDQPPALEELSNMVKTGSILDRAGFLQHSTDRELTEKILKKFEDCGLMRFLTYDYQSVHRMDFTEWFVNAKIVGDEIQSRVGNTDIIIGAGDIRAAFDFVVPEGAHSDLSRYAFEQQKLWEEIKADFAPANLKLSFKKRLLKTEYERAVDVIIKILQYKVAGTDDVNLEIFTLLSAIMENYPCNWPQIIFNFLRSYVERAVNVGSKSLNQKVGFGFLVQYLLHLKGIKLRPGVPVHRNTYLFKTKPQAHKRQAETPTKSKKKAVVAQESSSKVPLAKNLEKLLKSKKTKRRPLKDVRVVSKAVKMGGEEGDDTKVRDSVVEGEARAPIAQIVAVDVPTSRVKEEVTEIPVNVNVQTRSIPREPATTAADVTSESMDIDADAEIAAEMQMGETQPGSIVGGDSACIDEELLAEYMRVKAWQKWRISDFATIAAGISFMEPEEEFSLKWLNTSYIPEATSFALIDDVYSKKLAAREAEKGKYKAADEESQSTTPKDAEKAFQKDFRRAMQQSRLEQEMEGPGSTSGVGTRRPIREITPEQPTRSPDAREVAVLSSFQTKDVTQTLQCAEEAMKKMWGLVTRMANKVELMEEQAAAVQKKLSKIDEKMDDVYDKVGAIPAMNDKIDVITDGVINLYDKLSVFIDDAKKGEGSRRPPRRFGSAQQRASGSTSTSQDIVPFPDESYSLQNLLDYAKTWNMIHFKNEEIRKQKQEDEREREDEERKKRQRIMEQQTEKEILAKSAKYKEGTRLDSD